MTRRPSSGSSCRRRGSSSCGATSRSTTPTPEELKTALAELGGRIRGVVTNGTIGLTGAQMRAMPRLEIITTRGVGYERVDTATAVDMGVVITSGKGTNASSVADHAIGLMLAVARGIVTGDRRARERAWAQSRAPRADDRRQAPGHPRPRRDRPRGGAPRGRWLRDAGELSQPAAARGRRLRVPSDGAGACRRGRLRRRLHARRRGDAGHGRPDLPRCARAAGLLWMSGAAVSSTPQPWSMR